ncbi:MAG TPA: amylo-alpha-1,6-glucosidase [Candidatus Acidoferrum sp.]|nr:amylo-alpha-1,6-glucosidase [Candidatus Acidoferrum sp.]
MADIVRLENEYYVRASSALADDRTRVLKYGDTFAVFNRFGDIELVGPSKFGLFHAECRHLSQFAVHVNEHQPLLLSSNIREDNAFLAVDLTNVDSDANGFAALSRGTLHLFRLQFLRRAACYVQIRLLNYGPEPAEISLRLNFAADFADIFEVRGTVRERSGERLRDEFGDDKVILGYRGLDQVFRRTRLEFSPKPASLNAEEARFYFKLKPGEETSLFALVACEHEAEKPDPVPFPVAFASLTAPGKQPEFRNCRVATSSEGFDAWLNRSSADLRTLVEGNPEGPYPYAGVPWFSTVFGRDGIITALECLWMIPSFAQGVLSYLARTQATAAIPEQDAEPGKILHEMRRGEMATTKEVPFGRYYGSVDSTPLFVILSGAYLERTGDLPFVSNIWPHVKAALHWMHTYGDRDGDGFIEYAKQSTHGLIQQGWKDSHDSVFHADGSMAEPPIALCEVQAYAYAAKRAGAQLARALAEPELAARLDREAQTLRAAFEQAFWNDRLGTYALALDGRKRQCAVRVSNAGYALYCGVAREARARSVASVLMGPEMFSGWGVRTVASSEARYNPMSYHNGSVWPHDNAIIAAGFARYGMQSLAAEVLNALYEASRHIELQRMPELFCGFHKRTEGSGPTLYPVACAPQAWAAGSVFLMLSACLGIDITASPARVQLIRPSLPAALNELRIDNLRVGNGSVNLAFRRQGKRVDTEVTGRSGDVEVHESM